MDAASLARAAAGVRDAAYAPYSHYRVGAALLAEDGRVFLGCNVENASYGLTICAERTAVVSAVAAGVRRFVAIAVATEDGGSPCGACRQVLSEFALPLPVHLVDATGRITSVDLAELLPRAFGPRFRP